MSELASLSRALVADDFSEYAWSAEGNLSARAAAAPVEGDLCTTSAQAAEGNLRQLHDKASTAAVVDKANVVRDSELVRLCNVADHTNLGSTFREGHPETAWVSSALLVEKLTDQHIPKVDAHSAG